MSLAVSIMAWVRRRSVNGFSDEEPGGEDCLVVVVGSLCPGFLVEGSVASSFCSGSLFKQTHRVATPSVVCFLVTVAIFNAVSKDPSEPNHILVLRRRRDRGILGGTNDISRVLSGHLRGRR